MFLFSISCMMTKKNLLELGKKLFSSPNLIVLGTVAFYHGLYWIIMVGLGTLYGTLSRLAINNGLQGASQRIGELTDGLFSLYRGMGRFGIGMIIVLFSITQVINYKRKNISMASFLIMFIILAVFVAFYGFHILGMSN